MISYAGLVLCSVLNRPFSIPGRFNCSSLQNPSWLRFVFVAGDGEWKDRTPREAWNLMMLEVHLTNARIKAWKQRASNLAAKIFIINTSQLLPKWGKITTTFKESSSFKFQQNPPKKNSRRNIFRYTNNNAQLSFNWGSVIHGVRMLQEPGKANGARTPPWDVKTMRPQATWLGVGWCEEYL